MSDFREQFPETPKRKPTVAELYPHLSKDEQQRAEENLRRYVALVWRIFERVSRENPALLTETLKEARLKELKRDGK